jgi:hypothetical protein
MGQPERRSLIPLMNLFREMAEAAVAQQLRVLPVILSVSQRR